MRNRRELYGTEFAWVHTRQACWKQGAGGHRVFKWILFGHLKVQQYRLCFKLFLSNLGTLQMFPP